MGKFKFGKRSEKELIGVHPALVRVTRRALELTEVDFGVHDGLRTQKEQRALFRAKASQLDGVRKISKHQKQKDGYSHAVDLVPYINGKLRWEWPPIYVIARAVVAAARELDVNLRWGGCWRHINPFKGNPEDWVKDYGDLKRRQGKQSFPDGPHWELYKP